VNATVAQEVPQANRAGVFGWVLNKYC